MISTKLGDGVDGVEDWTGPCITGGVEQALRILRTDRIDIAHLLENVAWAAHGSLDTEVVSTWRERFRASDDGWIGQV